VPKAHGRRFGKAGLMDMHPLYWGKLCPRDSDAQAAAIPAETAAAAVYLSTCTYIKCHNSTHGSVVNILSFDLQQYILPL